MRAVSVRPLGGVAVEHRVVVVQEVPSVDVVDVAVGVVIDPIARDLVGVGPDVRREVRVIELDALVDHTYRHGTRPGVPLSPGLSGTGAELVGGRRAVALHAPETSVCEVRVVRRCFSGEEVVGLDVADTLGALDTGDSGGNGFTLGEREHLGVLRPRRQHLGRGGLGGGTNGGLVGERCSVRVADEQHARAMGSKVCVGDRGCRTGRLRRGIGT
ncbi:unannotated protein [freshwater metagenome]|uniref:Unannotated protein n=1 Tax=freshwater metagenome TaxID=449393 RepID=A0A6J7ERY4_9ZZZZ